MDRDFAEMNPEFGDTVQCSALYPWRDCDRCGDCNTVMPVGFTNEEFVLKPCGTSSCQSCGQCHTVLSDDGRL
jgi:MinD superfamily P-loop ATPase